MLDTLTYHSINTMPFVLCRLATAVDDDVGIEVDSLDIPTTMGPIRFDCWVIAGQHTMATLRDEYELRFDCTVITFDVTRRSTRKNVSIWHREIQSVCGSNTPVVLCGNRTGNVRHIQQELDRTAPACFLRKENVRYYELNPYAADTNITAPIEHLASELTGVPELKFLQSLSECAISPGWEECVERWGTHHLGTRTRQW